MNAPGTPMRWPKRWNRPSALGIIQGTSVDCLLMERGADLGEVAAQAKQNGLTIIEETAPPEAVRILKGEWPGVQSSRSGADASAGPTGTPWIDSNGWKVRLESTLHPGAAVWVDAQASGPRLSADGYVLAVADAAAHGGRWIISLDDSVAERLAAGETSATAAWKRLADAAGFFARQKEWAGYPGAAIMGVVSDFRGENEFMGQELLNLVGRTNQQYRIILKGSAAREAFEGLRAVIYADAAPPPAGLRSTILEFVQAGGLLFTGPNWGPAPGGAAAGEEHPRYAWRTIGKGRVAFAKAPFDDPWVVANDSVLLMSHRHELLRFWNGGSLGTYFTRARDGKRAVVHFLFFANRGPASASVRVAGRYASCRLWTLDRPQPRPLDFERQNDAIELHLPPMSQYAAAELEVAP